MFYVALTEPAVPTTLWRGQWSSDPDDDAFLATAFAFSANLLVSRDSDLLNVKQFYGCQIVEPSQALALCRQALGHVVLPVVLMCGASCHLTSLHYAR